MSNDIISRKGAVVGTWNGEGASELKAELARIRRKLLVEKSGDRVEAKGIPHRQQLPEDLRNFTPYILWACDKQGVCLAGSGANRLESVETIREYYANDIAKDAIRRHDSR